MTDEQLQKANSLKDRLHKLTIDHYALADLLNESSNKSSASSEMTGWKVKKLAGILDGLPHDVFEELLPKIGKLITPVIAAKMQSAQKEFAEL
jgi:hypothetical protein